MRQNERRGMARGAGALLVAALGLTVLAGSAAAATTWLGVYTQDLTQALREGLDYNGRGVLVNRVLEGSPADRAGIQSGDVITRFNNRQVDDSEDLTNLVRDSRAGSSVAIQIVRDGRTRNVSATLEERDDDARGSTWSWNRDDDDDDDNDRVRVRRAPRVHIERWDDDEGRNRFKIDGKDRDVVVLPDMRGFAPHVQMMNFRGRLGVQLQDLNEGLGEYFQTSEGALVTSVVEDSPAEKAGIRAGDVIVRFGGEDIEDSEDLSRAVREADEGAVEVTLIRKGIRMTVRPELEEGGRSYSWNWDEGDQERIRELADRARERAERARERAGRARERSEEITERHLRREMERLNQELRELERRLERLDEDED